MPAAVLSLMMRIDARRPASWLACGLAAAVVPALASAPAAAAAACAVACGGWLAVAAVGRPPGGGLPGMAGIEAAWRWARAAWPLVGGLAAATALQAVCPADPTVVCGLAIGVGVATGLAAAAARRGAVAADAASLGLSASTAAAAAAGVGGSGVRAIALAVAAAVGIAVAAWAWWQIGRDHLRLRGDEAAPAGLGFVEIGLDGLPLRRVLAGLTMAASLVGMAGWFFLAPADAPAGMMAAVAMFALLAVPVAALGPPVDGAGEALAEASPVEARRWPSWRRPGGRRRVVRVAGGQAAVLGWPPLVAGLIQSGAAGFGEAGPWPWITVAVLALAALVLVGLVVVSSGIGRSRETTLALASGLVVATLVAFATSLPGLCGLPKGPN